MTQVTLTQLTKQYANTPRPALDALSLEIESGQLTALLGPSGCGKTTTMKLIAGLIRPTSGDILFDQTSVRDVAAEKRGAVMVFQNYLLFPYMTVGENIGFGLKMRGINRTQIRKRVAAMLELVKLPGIEARKPAQLSGGQQQRVALARALIVEPRLLLLDEPLSNLDAHLRDEMRDLIRSIQRDLAITTLFVTHDQQEAVLMADTVALLFDGILQQVAPPRQFYERPASAAVAQFFGGQNFITGTMQNGMFETEIGRFQAEKSTVKQGKAILTIRPEAIEIATQPDEANTVSGIIDSITYVGTHTQFQLSIGAQTIQMIVPPHVGRDYAKGHVLALHLPHDRVCVVAVTKTNFA